MHRRDWISKKVSLEKYVKGEPHKFAKSRETGKALGAAAYTKTVKINSQIGKGLTVMWNTEKEVSYKQILFSLYILVAIQVNNERFLSICILKVSQCSSWSLFILDSFFWEKKIWERSWITTFFFEFT